MHRSRPSATSSRDLRRVRPASPRRGGRPPARRTGSARGRSRPARAIWRARSESSSSSGTISARMLSSGRRRSPRKPSPWPTSAAPARGPGCSQSCLVYCSERKNPAASIPDHRDRDRRSRRLHAAVAGLRKRRAAARAELTENTRSTENSANPIRRQLAQHLEVAVVGDLGPVDDLVGPNERARLEQVVLRRDLEVRGADALDRVRLERSPRHLPDRRAALLKVRLALGRLRDSLPDLRRREPQEVDSSWTRRRPRSRSRPGGASARRRRSRTRA